MKAPEPGVVEPEDKGRRASRIVSQGVENSSGGNAESGEIAGRVENAKREQGDEQKTTGIGLCAYITRRCSTDEIRPAASSRGTEDLYRSTHASWDAATQNPRQQ
jgi:hypothetical protein